jgi:23S rRNA (adenine2503-C2)-methyltransferase
MIVEYKSKEFANGKVYSLTTKDDYPIEVTDTFLPYYTKDAEHQKNNKLKTHEIGSRSERWMIGVSCMSGCPVGCKFCATGKLKRYRNLTSEEIIDQIKFILEKNPQYSFSDAKEHKINYTRMGEPFLNIENIKEAIKEIDSIYPGTHHYISTIGIKGSDISWIKDNITLQVSLHSLNEKRRNKLIPFANKMSIAELGAIRTGSNLKTTLNLTLIDKNDFDINELKRHFDPAYFFIKLSPINENEISMDNNIGKGIIKSTNLI